MMVLLMNVKMCVELVDTSRKHCYLNLRRTGIAFMYGVFRHDLLLFFACHFLTLLFIICPP